MDENLELELLLDYIKPKLGYEWTFVQINTLTWPIVYNNTLFMDKLCDELEKLGYSCRYGAQIYWEVGQSQQHYFLELFKLPRRFTHRNAQDYKRELVFRLA